MNRNWPSPALAWEKVVIACKLAQQARKQAG